jgi:hypothetical protein
MTVISSNEFAINQDKYFDMAIDEEIGVKRGENMFLVSIASEREEPDMIFEPDEDFYRSISMEEFRKRVKEDIHQWYKERNENNCITRSTAIS